MKMPARLRFKTSLAAAALAAVLMACASSFAAWAGESRYALLIGNSNYSSEGMLKNTLNDVRLMGSVLSRCGFKVMICENLANRDILDRLRTFSDQISKDSVALVYYSGHGAQYRGRNYLVPIGSNIKSESDIEYECFDAARMIDEIETKGPKLKIIILDACRNNPFGKSFRRSISRGLTAMKGTSDTMIAYATAPDDVASDGAGDNSPYAEALAENILKPGLDIEKVFKLTRTAVLSKTNNEQRPWETSSLTSEFYFSESGTAGQAEPQKAPEPPAAPATSSRQEPPTVISSSNEPEKEAQTDKTEIVIFQNGNIYGVDSNPKSVPSAPTVFAVARPAFITHLETYHYFNNGVRPGKITLRHGDGTVYGPWQAHGRAGQGKVSDAYWDAEPNIEIKPGSYTVIDSHPKTWSFNAGSGGAGFVIIKGYYK